VGTLGRVAQVYRQLDGCTVDTHVTIVRPAATLDADFFGCAMLALQETFERLGVGATGQTELGRKAIEQVAFPIPSSDTQSAFGQAVRPMRTLAERLSHRIEILRRTRDLLLPKLISGALDVSTVAVESP
jgi:type I restriction enzyme S subunit